MLVFLNGKQFRYFHIIFTSCRQFWVVLSRRKLFYNKLRWYDTYASLSHPLTYTVTHTYKTHLQDILYKKGFTCTRCVSVRDFDQHSSRGSILSFTVFVFKYKVLVVAVVVIVEVLVVVVLVSLCMCIKIMCIGYHLVWFLCLPCVRSEFLFLHFFLCFCHLFLLLNIPIVVQLSCLCQR